MVLENKGNFLLFQLPLKWSLCFNISVAFVFSRFLSSSNAFSSCMSPLSFLTFFHFFNSSFHFFPLRHPSSMSTDSTELTRTLFDLHNPSSAYTEPVQLTQTIYDLQGSLQLTQTLLVCSSKSHSEIIKFRTAHVQFYCLQNILAYFTSCYRNHTFPSLN